MTQAEIREIWEARVAEYRASGQSASEWCAVHQVTTRQLWYWMRELKELNQKSMRGSAQWAAVNINKQRDETNDSTLRILIGSVAIEVKPGFHPSLLSDVVRTLQSLC